MDPDVTFANWRRYVATRNSSDIATIEGTRLIEWLHDGGRQPNWGSVNNRDTFFAWAIFRNIPWAQRVSAEVRHGDSENVRG